MDNKENSEQERRNQNSRRNQNGFVPEYTHNSFNNTRPEYQQGFYNLNTRTFEQSGQPQQGSHQSYRPHYSEPSDFPQHGGTYHYQGVNNYAHHQQSHNYYYGSQQQSQGYYHNNQQGNFYEPPPVNHTRQHNPTQSAHPDGSNKKCNKRFSNQRNRNDAGATNSQRKDDNPTGESISQSKNKLQGESEQKRGEKKQSIRFRHQQGNDQSNGQSASNGSGTSGRNNKTKKANASKPNKTQNTGLSKNLQSLNLKKGPKSNGNHQVATRIVGDQASLLVEELTNGQYDCMICSDPINPEQRVWSCKICYHVFHIGCIKKWAKTDSAKEEGGWRCPGCQSVNAKVPNIYFCFCGKQKNPPYVKGELPHSCGNVCNRNRNVLLKCRHKCTDLCHPGPCPKCPVMVKRKCQCGKVTKQERCNQLKHRVCNNPCKKLQNCKKHRCMEICHSEKCKDCEIVVQENCFCGKSKREIICGSKEDSSNTPEGGSSYPCGNVCEKLLSCEVHFCTKKCHQETCGKCPLSPDVMDRCPCTQTRIKELLSDENKRTKCTDPIPLCDKVCGKPLGCGGDDVHFCKLICHEGSCPPCGDGKKTTVICRCKRTVKNIACVEYVTINGAHLCEKRCNKKRSCGRHKCTNKCCIETEHLCEQKCGKKLSCGSHQCEEQCHRGVCPRCYNVSFDELSCHCGDTITYPPIHCGTRPPKCSRICSRVHSCTHAVRHTCHTDDKCPPCVELVKKVCNCGQVTRTNIMCHIDNVSCGCRCVKLLPCGHNCKKQCHKGACFEENDVCNQKCQTVRDDCKHTCANECHIGKPCPKTPCLEMVTCKCLCGRREQKISCEKEKKLRMKATISSMSSNNNTDSQMDIARLFIPNNAAAEKILPCVDECYIAERNHRLANALNINQERDVTNSSMFSPFLQQAAKRDIQFVIKVENELKSLVESVRWMNFKSKSFSFPIMKKEKRQIIHELAQAFTCESLSYDDEPKRHVRVTASKQKSQEPRRLLSDFVSNSSFAKSSSSFFTSDSSMKLVQYQSSQPSPMNMSSRNNTQVRNIGSFTSNVRTSWLPTPNYASSSTVVNERTDDDPTLGAGSTKNEEIDYFDVTD